MKVEVIGAPTMIQIVPTPQPPSEPTKVPEVEVYETKEVIDVFLRCIYPIPKPTVKDLELLEALVVTADKYETQIVLNMVESWVVTPENLKEDPLRAYAIACSSPDLRKSARDAAERMTFEKVINADPHMVARLTGRLPPTHHLSSKVGEGGQNRRRRPLVDNILQYPVRLQD